MLFAEARGTSLAIASSVPWTARSVGYVGTSDGWQTLIARRRFEARISVCAENGNVALAARSTLPTSNGRALLTMGFGAQPEEAAFRAILSLQHGAASALAETIPRVGADWQSLFLPLDEPARSRQS